MRKHLLPIIFIFLVQAGEVPFAHALTRADLRTGDVLLQSIPCYLCSLMEQEEDSPYSHIGVALKSSEGIQVLQALGSVKRSPLPDFIQLRRKNTRTLVLRPIGVRGGTLRFSARDFDEVFEHEFEGLHYDDAFLWENRDELGERMYCSEFVTKFLNRFLPRPIPTKAMHFQVRRDLWIQYFKGTPPDGLPGVSPGDFERSNFFVRVGEL